jgi:hypothetical protein
MQDCQGPRDRVCALSASLPSWKWCKLMYRFIPVTSTVRLPDPNRRAVRRVQPPCFCWLVFFRQHQLEGALSLFSATRPSFVTLQLMPFSLCNQNTSLPIPLPAKPTDAPVPPKTLPHAFSRAAKSGAAQIAAAEGGVSVGVGEKLGKALTTYGDAMEKVRSCVCEGGVIWCSCSLF